MVGNPSWETEAPTALVIQGNYPNPFNPSTTIDFSIDKAGFASLVIYNSMG